MSKKNKNKKKSQEGAKTSATHYLRVEAVNMGNFIYDTSDLSTIRGGGLILLRSTDVVATYLRNHTHGFDVVTRGASQAIFTFAPREGATAENVRSEVEKTLRTDREMKYATFVVDVIEIADPSQFVLDREKLIALNRFRQMRQMNLSVPPLRTSSSETPLDRDKPCGVDLVRPASEEREVRNRTKAVEKQVVSEIVAVRANHGRKQKSQFYLEEMRKFKSALEGNDYRNDLPYFSAKPEELVQWKSATGKTVAFLENEKVPLVARDFGQIGSGGPERVADNKIAVIYLDGNSFGKVQTLYCDTPARQKNFDGYLRTLRWRLLAKLLEKIRQGEKEWTNPDSEKAIRLETLLWGGDELSWVVPAWKGWETIQLIMDETEQWPHWVPPEKKDPEKKDTEKKDSVKNPVRIKMTLSISVVFCSIKAPIHRIRSLASEMAEFVKESTQRKQNAVAVQVLESFDHLEGDFKVLRAKQLPPGATVSDLVITGDTIESLNRSLKAAKKGFPKSQLYAIVRHLLKNDLAKAQQAFARAKEDAALDGELLEQMEKTLKAKTLRSSSLVGGPAWWMLLAELWDYLPIESAESARVPS